MRPLRARRSPVYHGISDRVASISGTAARRSGRSKYPLAVGIVDGILRLFVRRNDGDAPPRLPSPDELALASRPQGEIDAQLQRQMLASEGIPAMVKNRDPVSSESGGMGPTWAYELWVLRRDLRRAREILGDGTDDSDGS